MHIHIDPKRGKLELSDLVCDCAFDHNMPDMAVYIKSGLLGECAQCIQNHNLGSRVLIVADKITYGVAAETVENQLAASGLDTRMCILKGNDIEPTLQRVDEIVAAVQHDTEFLLAVGSGVITDLTRQAATRTELPFAVFGTAASMDGYTSITSAMMIDGMKVTLFGKSAALLMFDPAVLATAPLIMQAAGVGDVLAKYNVLVDWKLGSAVSGETFCPLCATLLETALDRCLSNIDEIAKRSEAGMHALIEALIFAGLTVLIVGYTRPVASVEHNISHYFEMMALAYGGSAPSHGVGVGIGLVYALIMHDMLRSADLTRINKNAVKSARMTKEEKRKFMISHYPPGIGEEVMQANEYWYLNEQQHEARFDALVTYHEQYKKDCTILPNYKDIIQYMEQLGAPSSAAKAGIDAERLKKALLCTHNYRARYSIGAALSELGMLEECVDKILEMEKDL